MKEMTKVNARTKKTLSKWVRPVVKSEKLSTRSLLGENGWFGKNQNMTLAQVAT